MRLFSLLLRAYPPSFRHAHGREMQQVAQALLDSRGRRAWIVLAADTARSVPREWLRALRGTGHHTRAVSAGPTGDPMQNLVRDVRYAARLLARTPGFAMAAILTLALGIGANTAIFTLADATLLRPLKEVSDPDRLVVFSWSASFPDYRDYAERRDVFSGVAATSGSRVSVSIDGRSDLVNSAFVSGNLFGVLGTGAALGRTLLPSDDVPGAPLVGVVSHPYWQSRFGGDAGVIGKTITVNGRPLTIVGVAARGFRGTTLLSAPAVYIPLTSVTHVRTGFFAQTDALGRRNFVWLRVVGRLQPAVTPEQAASAMDTLYRQLHPPPPGRTPEVMRMTPLAASALGTNNAGAVKRFMLLLSGVVVITLLVGCANLANLLLARAAGRRREVGVRLALGARRAQVVRQMLTESVLLSSIGGATGLLVAFGALRLLASYQLPGGVGIEGLNLGIDGRTLAVTAALSLLTGVVFGAAPAWRASRTNVIVSLRDESRGASARSTLRTSLVAVQVALSLVLLAGSGLFLRSLVHALDVPLGFTPDGAVTASVNLGLARFDAVRAKTFYAEALQRVRALPQVRAAAWSTLIPTAGQMVIDMEIDGYTRAPQEDITLSASQVGPEYFTAAGSRVVQGRPFATTDDLSAPKVAIVNEAAAAKYWKGMALGGRIRVAGGKQAWATIVGVVENAKVRQLDEAPIPYVYYPFDQVLEGTGVALDSAHLFVRAAEDRDAELLPALVSEQVRGVDAAVPLYDVRPLAETTRALAMPQRMGVTLFTLFSVLALALATVGIYGVASYVAALRTREIGIRIALGAGRSEIRRLVLGQGLLPVAIGVVAGLALALWAARLATAFLYDVSPWDPLTFSAVALLLVTVSLLAGYLPARRAAGLDPVTALRYE